MTKFLRQNRERVNGLLFVLPAVVYMLIMMVYPLVYNFVLSFKDLSVMNFKGNTSVFVGFTNYVNIIGDKIFSRRSGKRSGSPSPASWCNSPWASCWPCFSTESSSWPVLSAV
jgi:ABC-type sugar transport system permease subunit